MWIVVKLWTPGERNVGFTIGSNAPSVIAQAPLTHAAVGPHALPHMPQLAESVLVSVQPVMQHVWPVAHAGPPLHVIVGLQTLATHVLPIGQTVPHAPQLFASVAVSVQPVMQHFLPPVQ